MSMIEAPSRLDVITRIDVFRDLSLDTKMRLAEIANLHHYHKDMFVFAEGDPANSFCFLHSGIVKAFRTSMDGVEHTLYLLRPGDVFAFQGFLSGGSYHTTTQALEDSWIGFIPNTALHALAQRDVDVAYALLRLFGKRLVDLEQQVLDLTAHGAASKLAAVLLHLAERHGEPTPSGLRMPLHLTHRELGQLIGASRETVTRLLREFRNDQAVQLADGQMLVQPAMLRAYLE